MKKEDYLFYAKTNEGYIIKILFELLKQCTKTATFNITNEGIHLCSMGTSTKLLIALELIKTNFSEYYCKEPLNVGLNLNHIHKMIKSIKKKDSVIFYIQDDKYFTIKIIPHENTRIVESNINIQDLECIGYEVPEGYENHPIIISSSDYQKACKELTDIGQNIKIIAGKEWINFSCDAASVYGRNILFGSKDDEVTYEQMFEASQLLRLIKLSGLCRNVKIYPVENIPLKISSNVGELGHISLYLKSVEQTLEEKENEEDEE